MEFDAKDYLYQRGHGWGHVMIMVLSLLCRSTVCGYLNILPMQRVMEDSVTNAQQIMSAQSPFEMVSIVAGQAQPTAVKMRSYFQHFTNMPLQRK